MTLLSFVVLLFASLAPPGNVTARDVPNDGGREIGLTWTRADDATVTGYRILRQAQGNEQWETLGFVGRLAARYTDDAAENGKPYRYKVLAFADTLSAESEPSAYAAAAPQWFDANTLPSLIGTALLMFMFVYFIERAKKNKHLFIRRISGLDSIEEALGFCCLTVGDDFGPLVRFGRRPKASDIAEVHGEFQSGDHVLLKDAHGSLLAIGTATVASDGLKPGSRREILTYERVLA